ncbi:MAG: hypothetical protein WC458_03210 [Patescibacteria group bacterium]
MRKKVFWSLLGILMIIVTGCEKAPDDFIEASGGGNWKATITASAWTLYIGDDISLGVVLTDDTTAGAAAFDWKVLDPDGLVQNFKTKNIKVSATKVGDYSFTVEVTKNGKTKTAEAQIKILPRGVIISLSQDGINYRSGDNLELDSLKIKFKITATATDNALGRFSLNFGDGTVIDSLTNSGQVIVSHRYQNYGDYTVEFINSETVTKKISLVENDPEIPNDPVDTSTTVYDLDIDEYTDVIYPSSTSTTEFKDALFGKVDKINKKVYLLFSVAAGERPIGPETEVAWKGNWEGKNYGDWSKYSSGTGKKMVFTTKKGKYVRLVINNYVVDFLYRGNIHLDEEVWVNAKNASPFYGTDPGIGDTGTMRLTIDNDGKIHAPK